MAVSSSTGPLDAIVLAGGAGRRLGGRDKAALQVGGATLLDRVLDALADADADRIVVAGPRRNVRVRRQPRWTREDPPGSGPLAGLAAGLAALARTPMASVGSTADTTNTAGAALVLVCATDLPWLDTATVRRLAATLGEDPDADAAMLEDAEGRRQPLAACYRGQALAAALRAIGDPEDRPMRLLFDHLTVTAIPAARQARDIDTPDDLEVVMLNEWARRLAEELGVGDELADLELDPILNLARDAAHTIERPAAPVTTFIAGYAAARRAAGSSEVEPCVGEASRFTLSAGAEHSAGGDTSGAGSTAPGQ